VGQKCAATNVDTGDASCIAAGVGLAGDACTADEECGVDLACVDARCRVACTSDDPLSCPDRSTCVQVYNASGYAIPSTFTCTQNCDPIDPARDDAQFQACASLERCSAFTEGSWCVPSTAQLAVGSICDSSDQCIAGSDCFGSICKPYCLDQQDCAAGTVCVDQGLVTAAGESVGTCFTSCEPVGAAAQASCPAGQYCLPTSAGTDCFRADGNGGLGATCALQTECLPGLGCLDSACTTLCRTSSDCAATETCQLNFNRFDAAGVAVGFCVL